MPIICVSVITYYLHRVTDITYIECSTGTDLCSKCLKQFYFEPTDNQTKTKKKKIFMINVTLDNQLE